MFDSRRKRYNSFLSRFYALERFRQEYDLVPVFCTITAPAKFHHSGDRYGAVEFLKREFKNFIDDKSVREYVFAYSKVFEPHKSGIPHLHILFLVKRGTYWKFFKKWVHRFRDVLSVQNRIEVVKYKVTTYMTKYLRKNLENDDYFEWCRDLRIRGIFFSRFFLPYTIYKRFVHLLKQKIYYSDFLLQYTKVEIVERFMLQKINRYNPLIFFRNVYKIYRVYVDDVWIASPVVMYRRAYHRMKFGDGYTFFLLD